MRTAGAGWKRRLSISLVTVTALAAIGSLLLLAAAGDLDPTFGTGGVVRTDIPTCCDLANDVAIQADGKIVAAGFVIDGVDTVVDYDFALARYNPDGSPDSSFGTGGIVVTKLFAGSADQAHSVAIQSDGKILVAGRSFLRPVNQFAVARYLPNGSLDPTFSGDGKATVAFPFDDAEAFSVKVQTDGRIVLVGNAWNDFSGYDFAAARLMADGSPDLTFGGAGIVTTPISTGTTADIFSPDDLVAAALVQPDGKIIAAGFTTKADGNGDMALVRYLPDGSLDTGFGTGGKAIFNFYGTHADATALALQTDGKIVAGGVAFNPSGFRREFALARLNPDGTLDPTFDDDGRVTTRIDPLDAWMTDLALQADGRIVAVGRFGNDIVLARYRTNGALDTSFSADGVTTTDLGATESASALAIQSDGRIVTAGQAFPLSGGGNFATFLLLRYDGGSGQLEQTIDFVPLSDRTFGDPPFDVSATATSGLPVTFSASGACSISGATVTLTGSGTCSITASQDGNATYAPAPDVTRSFQVLNARILTITLTGTGTGRVTSSPDGIDCGTDCSETYQDGAIVTLTPLAVTGSTFVAWGGDADCSDGMITMNANVSCSATFDRTATTTTISSSLNPSTFNAAVTFTAAVTGTNPTGTVTVRDGGTTLGTPIALSGGSASLTLSSLTVGTHSITAQYDGDSSNAGSTSAPLSQVVDKATPAVTLISSKNPSAPAEMVTLSGTVPASATGSVTIFDGVLSLGDATVSGGGYALATSTLTTGSHTLKARYNGDGNYLSAESAPLIQVVETGNRAPEISPVADQTATWGSALNFPIFASDADADPLTFSLVAPPAGAAITSGGQFTWTPSSSQVGLIQITVQVTDTKVTTSASFNVTVNRQGTTVSYLGPGAAASGPVELSARLTDVQNAPVAGRTISFQLGTQNVSATTDATGLATATLMLNQPVGSVTLTASFAGDGAYAPSSSTFAFRINAAPVLAPIAPQSIAWGQTLSFFVDASDPEGSALTFTLLNAPPGVGLNFESPTRRSVVWTPTQAQVGAATITIGVSDGVTTVPVLVAVDVLRRATAITQIAPGASGAGRVVLTAALRDAVLGTPLAGRTVVFMLAGQTTAAPTDASGVANASMDIIQAPQTTPLIVSFPGETLYAPGQASQPFVIYLDSDGDGIRDQWEINGVDIDGNGSIDLNLPAMGANPRRKDIFIEADWMVKPSACVWLVCWSNGGVLQPQRAALDALVARFRTAPVNNPDGSIGINLHIDGGPNTVMNPISGEPWGPFSRAGVVPYSETLGTVDFAGNYNWSQFESIKQAFFEQARRAVFHYVIYANRLAATTAVGISRGIPAADFVIAAGDPSWNGGLTVTQEQGVFMHELGHNLALHHGGADDINYKPNYHSVVNYQWALIGVPPTNRFDYSNLLEPPVDEALAGDVNGDGRIDTLVGYHDWPNLVLTGGGIGDLLAAPPPVMTPVDPIDPDELRARGAYARAGEGLIDFKGPSLLVLNSGVQSVAVDVKNISDAAAGYDVSAEGGMLPGPVSGSISVAAESVGRVLLPVDTTGLVPGEYLVTLALRSTAGELLNQQQITIAVVDLTVAENQEAARQALDALNALPPDSGLDGSVKDQILRTLETAMVSWTAEVHVTGREAFDQVYRIDEPAIGRAPGPITVQSLAGAPLCEVKLLRAGKAASGSVRLQRPSGEIFDAPIAGSWNDSTRTFEGKWLDGKRAGGSLSFTLHPPQ